MPHVAFGHEEMPAETRGVLGIFCRANHPLGFGFCEGWVDTTTSRHVGATAHGYVTVLTVSPDWERHQECVEVLSRGDFAGNGAVSVWAKEDKWFGGPYECAFAFEGTITDVPMARTWGPQGYRYDMPNNSGVYGDNRFFRLMTYEEVMKL